MLQNVQQRTAKRVSKALLPQLNAHIEHVQKNGNFMQCHSIQFRARILFQKIATLPFIRRIQKNYGIFHCNTQNKSDGSDALEKYNHKIIVFRRYNHELGFKF